MLKGIDPVISRELLKVLAEMGHGDEIVFADAHFPAHQLNHRVIRADGIGIPRLLSAVSPLIELDQYVDAPLIMMQAVAGDQLDPSVESRYLVAMQTAGESILPNIKRIERFAFYEKARQAYAIVVTGETAKYGNILIKKGVIPVKD